MQLTYLCPKHIDWVYNNPREAQLFLQRDETQGSLLFSQSAYAEAIPYLGCAFDIAAILLELEDQNLIPLLNRIQGLSYLLVSAYQAAGRQDCQEAIAFRAISIVNASMSAKELSVFVKK